MKKRIAVYAGSFDPPTNGHLWMITKGAEQYDKLIVAIGANPNKQCLFTVKERKDMLWSSIEGKFENVFLADFPYMYLVKFAKTIRAKYVLRGLRSAADLEYEQVMRNINKDIEPDITTVFLIPPEELCKVSSSIVKSLVGPEGWEEVVSRYVSAPVLLKLREKNG